MSTYVIIVKCTDQGMRKVGESPERIDKAKRALKEMGDQFTSFYMTMGEYDLVAVYDAPDDAIAARFSLLLSMLGNVRSTTLKAFPYKAYREIHNSRG